MKNIALEIESAQTPPRLLVIELEPTHYKVDLWNAFTDSKKIDVYVIYTERKNWSPEGGHNYLKFPEYRHDHIILEGRGMLGSFKSTIYVLKSIIIKETDLVFICGYVHPQTVVALFLCLIFQKRFVVHFDVINNGWPPGKFSSFKALVRMIFRKLIFRYSEAIPVCGRRGVESALAAGCELRKIVNFPYTIDVIRLKNDDPGKIPDECISDLQNGIPIIFFSGRMIPRKGFPTLLAALSDNEVKRNWILWIEGAGPELDNYIAQAREVGIYDRCRFLGFCQYDLHSWLIRSADIIVVPSLEDSWGIVVDEGLQLGKAVIASDATGSGYDRIINKSNGCIFPAGNPIALAQVLAILLEDKNQRDLLGHIAKSGINNIRPSHNLETLLKVIQ